MSALKRMEVAHMTRRGKKGLNREEEDYLDSEGFRELVRLAGNARLFYRDAVMLRRHGK